MFDAPLNFFRPTPSWLPPSRSMFDAPFKYFLEARCRKHQRHTSYSSNYEFGNQGLEQEVPPKSLISGAENKPSGHGEVLLHTQKDNNFEGANES